MLTTLLLLLCQEWKAELKDSAIPMRDGKSLAADIFLPPAAGKYPTVLIQTPYNRKGLGAPIGSGRGDGGEAGRGAVSDALGLLDREHYAYVVVDWRGFYGSKGAMEGVRRGPWRRGQDGFDCVEWIAKQEWSDGKVGTWGGSALGRVQFETALEHPPHLVCAVPLIAPMAQAYETYYENGLLLEAHVDTLDKLGFGVGEIVKRFPDPAAPAWRLAERTTYKPEEIRVPCLMITGWWDHYPDPVIRTFEDIAAKGGEAARKHSRLLVGPWDHVGIGLAKQGELTFEGAAKYSAQMAKQFLDLHLRGEGKGIEPVVQWWTIGGGAWESAASWSGLKRATTTVALKGGGAWAHDPKDPSPTLGGANLPPLKHGPHDQSALEKRKDVLRWDAALEKPLRVNGNVELSFEATADGDAFDVCARLCDGKGFLLADAARRVKAKAGEKTRVTLRFPATAVAARELRVYVAGSNWPRYEKGPAVSVTVHGGAELKLPTVE